MNETVIIYMNSQQTLKALQAVEIHVKLTLDYTEVWTLKPEAMVSRKIQTTSGNFQD